MVEMTQTRRADLIRSGTGRAVSPATRPDPESGLISRVQTTRAEVNRYLRTTGARRRRLLNLSIVTGAIATALTAAPALGGKTFADWITATFGLSSPSWQILCALAAACSLTAAVVTQLNNSKNYEEHIAHAQQIRATLEMLEIGIATGHLSRRDATSQYLKCVENTTFIEATK
jgi:MFS family permease